MELILIPSTDNIISLELEPTQDIILKISNINFDNIAVVSMDTSFSITIPKTAGNLEQLSDMWSISSVTSLNISNKIPCYINAYNNAYKGYIIFNGHNDNYINCTFFSELLSIKLILAPNGVPLKLTDLNIGTDFQLGGSANNPLQAAYVRPYYEYSNEIDNAISYYNHASQATITERIFSFCISYQGKYDDNSQFDNNQLWQNYYLNIGSNVSVKDERSNAISVLRAGDGSTLNLSYNDSPELNENRRTIFKTNVDSNGTLLGYSVVRNCEYRACKQKYSVRFRYLYNKILDIFKDAGYNISLDSNFFNERNYYWANTWVVFPYNKDSNETTTLDKTVVFTINSELLKFFNSYNSIFGLKIRLENETIYVETIETYFNSNSIDITDKIDLATVKDVNYYNNKYGRIVFKWRENGSFYDKKYKERYGQDYGSFISNINTTSENELDIFKDNIFQNCIIVTDVGNYYWYRTGQPVFRDNKSLPYFENNNSNTQEMPVLFIRNPVVVTNLLIPFTDNYRTTDFSCWNNAQAVSEVQYVMGNMHSYSRNHPLFSLNFGIPAVIYSDIEQVANQSATIYYRVWQRFINEIFSENSKIIEIEAYITYAELIKYKHSPLVINDVGYYLVEAICSLKNGKSNLKLIRINNIANWIAGQAFT